MTFHTVCSALLFTASVSAASAQVRPVATVPRTPDGRPDLQGIWQVPNRAAYDLEDHVARYGMPAGRSVVNGGGIPYQPWAATKKRENFANRASADPLAQCYMPGVPRIMYMEFPFQLFQTRDHVAMLFEWQQVYRLISEREPAGRRDSLLDGRLTRTLGRRRADRRGHEP